MTVRGNPSWPIVKVKLADFDRRGLIGLVQSLNAGICQASTALYAVRLQRILPGNP